MLLTNVIDFNTININFLKETISTFKVNCEMHCEVYMWRVAVGFGSPAVLKAIAEDTVTNKLLFFKINLIF